MAGWNLFSSWRLNINWNWWETTIKEDASSKRSRFQRCNNWWSETSSCPLLKKTAEHLILHIGTNDAVSKTSRQILEVLFQLKQYIINTLPTCRVIVSRPTIRTDNGKAALTLCNFNKLLGQLEVDFIDNVNIKEAHLAKKGLHLNKKGKNRLQLNLLQKLRNLWWSTEHFNKTYDKSCNLNRSFKDDLKNRDNLLNSISSIYPDSLMVCIFNLAWIKKK